MIRSIILLLVIVAFTGCESGGGTLLSPNEFNSRIHATTQIQLVDVRTPKEFAEGHLEGAVNIDYNGVDFTNQIETLTKTMTVYVYCRSGRRSAAAATQMTELGFQDVYDLDGGILAWEDRELPTE